MAREIFRARDGMPLAQVRSVEKHINEIDGQLTQTIEDMGLIEAGVSLSSGWGAYIHTGSTQSLTTTKVTLTNNAGSVIESQKPADVATFYNGSKITGRDGDSIMAVAELTFTPSSSAASSFYMAIDLGGSVGELYPEDFPVTKGAGVAHKIIYKTPAYMLDTWEANGGAVKVQADGPGVVSAVRYIIHRLHKARS